MASRLVDRRKQDERRPGQEGLSKLEWVVNTGSRAAPFGNHRQPAQAREMAQAPTLVRARRAKHEHAASPRQPAQCRPKLLIQALIGDQPLLRTGLAAGHGASYSPSP